MTVDNFARAESDLYFGRVCSIAGGTGKWNIHRTVMDVHHQTVIRANRDTLYSAVVLDLDAGPATVTLPDPGERFLSAIVIDEDQYTSPATYGPATLTLTREQLDTRYAMVGVRILVNPTKPGDLDEVHALQDALHIEQDSAGSFEAPAWDKASQDATRKALIELAGHVPDARRMFGARHEVDPMRHLIGTASGWGGNREADATYITVTPKLNDGTTPHSLTVRDVPVNGFWSIAVYNADGYFEPNDLDSYGPNSFTAVANADGSVTVNFGGDPAAVNYVPITPGWNYWVRLYRPRPEILDGTWTFPEAQPVVG
ncbi:DUF1254 domain-containing protein [Mycobacterium sp. 155]|uniref:DUF1254 domain-containing protein n=1 Tax=Mycobacterium sp. 155 TaxID=1157943 RepID=UPI0018DEED08|nr:DUF1254 domain-containing protein [Mycobacterium sp. 155]